MGKPAATDRPRLTPLSHSFTLDLALGFQLRADAMRFLEEFKERLAKFGLELHPEKTRLIEFGRYAARDRQRRGAGKPETFTFLGFTHYCGRRHKTDTFTVWRITAKQRMVAKLKAIKVELRRRMHARPSEVGAWLRKVVNGYYQYHAVPGNLRQLRTFRQRISRRDVHSAMGSAIEVRLSNGRSLIVAPEFDASHLRALLAVVESES